MQYFHSIVLGIIEGTTEFLPISSTFHLIWTSKLLNIPQTEFQKAFEVIIQSGAILAVVFLYFSLYSILKFITFLSKGEVLPFFLKKINNRG